MRYRKYGRDRRRETGLGTLKAISDVLHTDLTSNSPPAPRSSGAASRNTHTHTLPNALLHHFNKNKPCAVCLYIHELFKVLQHRCFHADAVNTDRPRADGHYQVDVEVHTHTKLPQAVMIKLLSRSVSLLLERIWLGLSCQSLVRGRRRGEEDCLP